MDTSPESLGPAGPVLALSSNPELLVRLRSALACDGLTLARVATLPELIQRLAGDAASGGAASRARLVLVDMAALTDPQALVALGPLVEASKGTGPLLVCLAAETDLRGRLAALRTGAAECLSGEGDSVQTIARIRSLLGLDGEVPARVLVVDDQPVSALFAARVLEGAGMATERVGDPLAVLDALERFRPDLVLMDLHMPGASGIELTRIIRDQAQFADLPIVFLSVEMDPGQQLNALRVGGDDFLAKPVLPQVLVDCVRRRLAIARRRLRQKATLSLLDPITGLASREHLLARIDRQMAAGAGPQWALLYLEHAWEEPVLQRVVPVIAGLADSDDVVARVGEHGLGILARRTGTDALARFAEGLVAGVQEALGDGAAVRRGSFGVGWCPLHLGGDEAVTLVSRARKAAQLGLSAGTGGPVPYLQAPRAPRTEERDPILAAIEAQRFQSLYQPIVDLWEAGRARYELAVRLRLGDGELLVPRAFAPLAVRAGLARRVDHWTLRAGLEALVGCRSTGRMVELLVPQSMVSLSLDPWVDALRNAIDALDLIRWRPLIQLQLADVDRNLALAARRATELERFGIRLCLDGFRDGPRGDRVLAAVPAALVRLPLDATRDWRPERLKDLVARFRARGIRVIAGGADAPEAIARVCAAGVSLIQGPFVHPPLESMSFDFTSTEPAV
ncbi:MAG: EAL domain-containing protein [Bdellovibrio bacteriovorus]